MYFQKTAAFWRYGTEYLFPAACNKVVEVAGWSCRKIDKRRHPFIDQVFAIGYLNLCAGRHVQCDAGPSETDTS